MSVQTGQYAQQTVTKFVPVVSKKNEKLMKIGLVVMGIGFVITISMLIADLSKIDKLKAQQTDQFNNIMEKLDELEDSGDWLVIQRRIDGSVDFYRDWSDYVNGFGDPSQEFWIGLETLNQLTSSSNYELHINLEDWGGNKGYASYSSFKISSASYNYRLVLGSYLGGTAGDSFSVHNGMEFSTYDRDNDRSPSSSCAANYHGAWWYNACHESNLNGKYYPAGVVTCSAIVWESWYNDCSSLKFTEMRIKYVH